MAAYESSNGKACYYLAKMCEEGRVKDSNWINANIWYRKGADMADLQCLKY